jgi:hypothetical protein
VLRGALVDTAKMKKTNTLFSFCFQVSWAQFLTIATSIDLPGDAQVVCSAREHVWGCFLVTWRWGGRDLPGACLRTLGWFLPGKSAFIL